MQHSGDNYPQGCCRQTRQTSTAVCVHCVAIHGAFDEFIATMHGWEISTIPLSQVKWPDCCVSVSLSYCSPFSAVACLSTLSSAAVNRASHCVIHALLQMRLRYVGLSIGALSFAR